MSDWIEWSGGISNPVRDGVKHYRQYRDQSRETAIKNDVYDRSEAAFIWEHLGNDLDIIAYKVIEQ